VSIYLLLAVLVVFLAAGVSSGRSPATRGEFFVAGRRGSVRAIAGSLFATVVGGSATIGVAGLVYERGLTGAWWSLVGALALVVLGLALVRRIRAYDAFTLPDLVERMYGRRVSILVATLVVVAWTGVVSGQIVAVARVVGAAGPAGTAGWMAGFTAVLVTYAILGGQRAILRTDALQGVLIFIGLGLAAAALLSQDSAWSGLMTGLPDGALRFPVSDAFGWPALLTMLVLVGSVYLVGPDIYTRVFSARDAATARWAVLWAAGCVVPAAVLVTAVGLVARVLAPSIAAEQAIPWLMANALPPAVAGILMVGLIAALMSSADSTLLGQGVVLANDVIGRIWSLGDRRAVLVSRICVGLLGLASLLLALSLRGVIASLLFAYSVFTSGVVGPVLLGLLLNGRWRPSGRAAFAGVCAGGALGLAGAIPGPAIPLQAHLPLIGLALSVAAPLAITAIGILGRPMQP
jgi:SSS family solute:Na+ symporter